MAYNVLRGKRRKVLLSPAIHPEYRAVVRTYVQGMPIEVVGDDDWPGGLARQRTSALIDQIDDDTFCVAVQNPDFFGALGRPGRPARPGRGRPRQARPADRGRLSDRPGPDPAARRVRGRHCRGRSAAPGHRPQLWRPLPRLLLPAGKKHVHKMAGRLVGQTVDVEGQRGYVLTLSAREQHIRRERATSNICTNQSLCALASAVYLSTLGRGGLRQVAKLCYHKAHYLAAQIDQLDGYELATTRPFFNEFVIRCPKPVQRDQRPPARAIASSAGWTSPAFTRAWTTRCCSAPPRSTAERCWIAWCAPWRKSHEHTNHATQPL